MRIKSTRQMNKLWWALFTALLITTLACGITARTENSINAAKDSLAEKAGEGLGTLGELAKNTAKDAVASALQSVNIDKSFNLSIPITDSAVNKIIQLKEKANQLTINQTLIENLRLSFTGGNVVVTGNVKDILFQQLNLQGSNQLTVIFRPEVTDGSVHLSLIEAKIGDTPAPESVFSAIEQTQTAATDTLQEMVNAVKGNLETEVSNTGKSAVVQVNDIVIEEGKMTVKLAVNIP